MHIGYNTNSLADHPLADALGLIADEGYTAVALTVGYPHVRPFDSDLGSQLGALRALLDSYGLKVAIETGARYLLDPRNKHKPSLVDIAGEARVEFMRRAIDIAADLGATCVSLWSGYAVSHSDPATTRELLLSRLAQVVDYADRKAVTLGFEPEPGMFVETVAQARDVCRALGDPARLGITLDVGHCVMTEPAGAAAAIADLGDKLVNVHLDDMTPLKHEHLEFGDGDLDLGSVLDALRGSGFGGVASVELPRHSHDAPNVVRRSMSAIKLAGLPVQARSWIAKASAEIGRAPDKVVELFPGATRGVGGSSDAVLLAREKLFSTLVAENDSVAAPLIEKLYRWGDSDERLAVLRGLEIAALNGQPGPEACSTGVALVEDALRCNEPRLVGAALGGFAARYLSQHAWRHGVMKLVFMEVPLQAVAGLHNRADAELGRMANDYVNERRAAGRSVSDDVTMLQRLTATETEVAT
ncbi:EboA domain-containing protein [Mycobacterium angelicum]|uniref:Sugar phosphate isomerase n=1 Tax=Mycobacterium angelicum TaxID=470074 RepID=A0A1W9ZSV2_MYCAN|nr:EboA domain-containing protein [Mycobacterium angelicum]MCV7200378.1 sugar phosphate isomerase/epimerase [Mycobacterium angelicum]ORA20861.1 sugar phosphate isomerase [Mycobacterium angelicum]